MNKGILRGIVLCLMLVAIVIVVVFIFKSNTKEKQYKSTVTISNNQDINNNSKNSNYVEAKKDENIIDYAENHYFGIIFFSTMSFIGLLVFYAFLSKKKEW